MKKSLIEDLLKEATVAPPFERREIEARYLRGLCSMALESLDGGELKGLFLRVLSQACGSHKDNKEIDHKFISAYEDACDWVCANGLGVESGTGCRLNEDPFDLPSPRKDEGV